jgi:hypothetical protein
MRPIDSVQLNQRFEDVTSFLNLSQTFLSFSQKLVYPFLAGAADVIRCRLDSVVFTGKFLLRQI